MTAQDIFFKVQGYGYGNGSYTATHCPSTRPDSSSYSTT
jgi:hypothetical protein